MYAVANCLLEWLNALRTPVIPEEYLEDLTYSKTLLAMVGNEREVEYSFRRKIEMSSFI